MDTKMTLTIPDYIYQQAEQMARSEQRSVEELLNEALAHLFPAVHINPKRPQMAQEQASFHRQHAALLAKYPGEFVALHQGQVVDHDVDHRALVARVDAQYADEVVLIKRVTADPDRVLHMRSPRLLAE